MARQRIAGLDFLRSIAVVTVAFTHSKHFIAPYFSSPISLSLPSGSDLFFALSGYLIGIILIEQTELHKTFTSRLFFNFLKRRWFRTLPNYFLFLLINIILIYFGLINGELNKFLITYFVFFQNFFKPYDFLFWESWNLAIQEWFYVLFPLMLLILFAIRKSFQKPKQVMLTAILVFLIVPLIYRILQPRPVDHVYWDLFFRKLVLTRFDAIGFGLLGAYIKSYYPVFWNKNKSIYFIIGCCSIIAVCYPSFENNILFYKTIYLTLLGFSILLIFPFLESIKNEPIPFKPFQFMSKISYSIFLTHVPVMQLLLDAYKPSGMASAFSMYALYWIIIISLSTFIYACFEKPIMDFGERFYSPPLS